MWHNYLLPFSFAGTYVFFSLSFTSPHLEVQNLERNSWGLSVIVPSIFLPKFRSNRRHFGIRRGGRIGTLPYSIIHLKRGRKKIGRHVYLSTTNSHPIILSLPLPPSLSPNSYPPILSLSFFLCLSLSRSLVPTIHSFTPAYSVSLSLPLSLTLFHPTRIHVEWKWSIGINGDPVYKTRPR